MLSRFSKSALLASSLLAVGSLVPGAFAQEGQAQEQDLIVVTGSRIAQPNLTATSPVTQINSDELFERGTIRIEDMVNTLPQAFAAQGGNYANGSSGTAQVNLRGLGASRTLVLVNGHRLPYGTALSQNSAIPSDLNQVPSSLVKRVEVLTGGASAVYGSDAIAGVVNFIMMDDFEGVRFDTQYSFFQHNNNNSAAQKRVTDSGFDVPKGNVTDGHGWDFTGVLGSNLDNGRGNITAYINYHHNDEVLQSERDYSSCTYGFSAGDFVCRGSPTSAEGNLLDLATGDFVHIDPGNNAIRPYNGSTDTFNYGPYNHFQRPDERWSAGVFAHYDLNDRAELYAEFMFHDDHTRAQIAPSGVFGNVNSLNCENPLYSANQLNYICTQYGLTSADVNDQILVYRRNFEGGGRVNDLRNTSYRGLIGVRGELFKGFNYDVFAQYANVHATNIYLNDFAIDRSARALDVVEDPVSGNPVCRSVLNGQDANCVPYNIWTAGGVTQEALDYLQVPLFSDGDVKQQVVSAAVTGDLGQYGVSTPWANEGLNIVLGAEYRRDRMDYRVDENYASGNGAGQGGPTQGVEGSSDVWDIFAEARLPLVEGKPMAESITLDMAYRYSSYSRGDTTDTYKIGGEWAPITDLRFRGSFQHAVRAANIIELYLAPSIALFDLTEGPNGNYDPCSGATPDATFEQCQRSGVTAAQYGSIADNPAGQFNYQQGGNTNLIPEASDTFTIGAVFSPSFIDGLTVSIDYFSIKVEDLIGTIEPGLILKLCHETGEARFCDAVNRGAAGTLFTDDSFIVSTNINTGSLQTKGLDIVANYGFDVGGAGSVELDLVGTLQQEFVIEPYSGADTIDCAGLFAGVCDNAGQAGPANPEWRHKFRATWLTPWNVDVSGSWRYTGEVKRYDSAGDTKNTKLDATSFFDLSATWQARESLRIRAGVNNILDTEPPLSSGLATGTGNGNTYAQIYDSNGRYVFLGATVDF